MSTIHPTAIIADTAQLASDVEVGPYTIIGEQVEIGSGSKIDSHVVINGPTVIGANNHIYQFASIGDDPQDKKYANEPTRLVIGDGNTIREFCTLSRGTIQDSGTTVVGDDNWIMAYVHIAHDCRVGNHTILANNATLAGHVHLGDWVIMGGFSGIHQFCRIGAHAFLGMFSAINRDVPAYTTVSGQPGVPRGINSEGLKRRGFDADNIRHIKDAYRTVYRKGLKIADAISELEGRLASQPELTVFVESLRASERGLVR